MQDGENLKQLCILMVVLWVVDRRWRDKGREPSEARGERQTGRYLFGSDGEQGAVFPRSVPANRGCSCSMLQVRPAGMGDSWPVPPAPINISIPDRHGHLSSILGLASCPQTPPCQSPRLMVVTLHMLDISGAKGQIFVPSSFSSDAE